MAEPQKLATITTMSHDELTKKRQQLSYAKEDVDPRLFRDPPKSNKKELIKLREKQRKFGLGSDSGKYAAHVYQVFNDPDFDLDIKKLQKQFDKLYYPKISLKTDYLDNHLLLDDKEIIKVLADKYCISLADLGLYADGFYEAGTHDFGKLVYEYGGFITIGSEYYENMTFFYALGPKTTLQQIADEWDYIQELMGTIWYNTNTKSKSPENPALIYTVFKARAKGLTFTEIFRKYQAGELIGYNGTNTKQYSSEDSLERYYRKYMPKPLGEILIDLRKME